MEEINSWEKAKKYTSTQNQFYVWERCTTVQKQMYSGKINFETSNSLTNTESDSGSMEHQLSSSGIFTRLATLQSLGEIQDKLDARQTKPEENIFTSTCNDNDWTKEGNSMECSSNSEKVKNYERKVPRGHLPLKFQRKWRSTIPRYPCVE